MRTTICLLLLLVMSIILGGVRCLRQEASRAGITPRKERPPSQEGSLFGRLLREAYHEKDPNLAAWAIIGLGYFSKGSDEDLRALAEMPEDMCVVSLAKGFDWPDRRERLAELMKRDGLSPPRGRLPRRSITLSWLALEAEVMIHKRADEGAELRNDGQMPQCEDR